MSDLLSLSTLKSLLCVLQPGIQLIGLILEALLSVLHVPQDVGVVGALRLELLVASAHVAQLVLDDVGLRVLLDGALELARHGAAEDGQVLAVYLYEEKMEVKGNYEENNIIDLSI